MFKHRDKSNHHSVLGVRRGATPVEIELAYQARKAQYTSIEKHLDAHAEQWEKRQLAELEIAYDALQSGIPAIAEATGQPAPCSGNTPASSHDDYHPPLAAFISPSYFLEKDRSRVLVSPDIPDHIARNARAARGRPVSTDSTLMAVFDDTFFRGGKEGLVITDSHMSFKSLGSSSVDYYYKGSATPQIETRNRDLYIHGEKCSSFVNFSEHAVSTISQIINDYRTSFLQWSLERAAIGDSQAMFNLANASRYGSDDYLHWLNLAAEHGHNVAQHNLAVELTGVDPRRAYELLLASSRQGNEIALQRLDNPLFTRFKFEQGKENEQNNGL